MEYGGGSNVTEMAPCVGTIANRLGFRLQHVHDSHVRTLADPG
jgi:hypothetical protein